ncbi:hypothetical protein [Qipengyuania sp. ASV99]|uniref:hypothetical protein n=1 Tax=Qipengyuania sp. ASV99 TaxID=3399681 RepID=UPI003A4C5245
MIASWYAPLADGKISEELLLSIDRGRALRVLILPALFDEANKLRRFTIQVMRKLDAAGVDSFLPDLPGCNESLEPLAKQTLTGWRTAAIAAAEQMAASHVLALRAGTLMAPEALPGWQFAPQTGPKLLRAMLRARTIAAREAGQEERADQLLDAGRREGLTLAGWEIGAELLRDLENAQPPAADHHAIVAQSQLGGAGLWLRAEPGEDDAQSTALADLIAGTQATLA